MSEIDNLLQQMQELTSAVKAAKPDPATLDFEAVKAQFSGQIESLVEAQVKTAMDRAPVYRQPGEGVASESGVITKANRYFPMVREFDRGAPYRVPGGVLKPVDLMLAAHMLSGQAKVREKGFISGPVPHGPSDDLKLALKAMTSTGSASGDELVPLDMAVQLWEDIFLASRVVSSFVAIPMPTNPFNVPLGLGDMTWRKGSENTATTASDPTTAKSVLTATELVTEQNWSYTLDEDAAIALAPALRARLAISGAEIVDAFALNADATDAGSGNINLDDANPANDTYYLSDGQDGLRHQWLVDNTAMGKDAGGDALTDTDIQTALGLMGKYAVNPEQVRMVMDVSTYLRGMLDIDTVQTIDKFGPSAVVVTGQLAAFMGIPIIVSASQSLTQADGKANATSNTLGQITIFNRMLWYAGFIRDLLVEVDRDIQKRQYIMVSSLRQAVAAHGTRSSATHTAGIYNILVA